MIVQKSRNIEMLLTDYLFLFESTKKSECIFYNNGEQN
jgi:hypothetical protein